MKVLSMVICAALALGAAGCEKKGNATNTPTNGGGAATTGTSQNTGSPAAANNTPGTAATTDAKQTSPVGAMRLFIDRMGRGEFRDALAYVEPTCGLHGDISKIVTSIEEAQKRNAENSAPAVEVIKASFAPPYRGAEASLLSEEAERAMVELKRVGFPPVNVTMVKGEGGNWFVSSRSDEGLFAPSLGGGPKPGR